MTARSAMCLILLAFAEKTSQAQNPPYLKPTSVAATDGPTTVDLATMIVDAASGVTVDTESVTTSINAATPTLSDERALGRFENGTVPAGTILHADNQVDPNNPTVTYAGGIGIYQGVCLCTGLLSDADGTPHPRRGLGVEGPNNGEPEVHAGEISTRLLKPIDMDFDDLVFPDNDSHGGDATVLQFNVIISSPGFLSVSFVFASDEYPAWIDAVFNDSFGILVRRAGQPYMNIATLKSPGMPTKPFSLHGIRDCGPLLFLENDVAPAPSALPSSEHSIAGVERYDHEFGGFTKKLTRETPVPLAPGTYMIKIVIQDVGTNPLEGDDRLVDSALFVEEHSLKLFPLAAGDFNGDGIVDAADYTVWRNHFGMSPATYYDGDGNGNGTVDAADYTVWRDHFGATGNKDFCADFNRDGAVDAADFDIQTPYLNQLEHCASRFEGDADGDGDVDDCDETIWLNESTTGIPSRPCDCSGGGAAMMAGGSGSETLEAFDVSSFKQQLPASPDVDGNGEVSAEELSELDALIAELSGGSAADFLAADESDEAAPAFLEPVAHESSSRNDSPHPSDFPGDSPRETSLLVAPPRNTSVVASICSTALAASM